MLPGKAIGAVLRRISKDLPPETLTIIQEFHAQVRAHHVIRYEHIHHVPWLYMYCQHASKSRLWRLPNPPHSHSPSSLCCKQVVQYLKVCNDPAQGAPLSEDLAARLPGVKALVGLEQTYKDA